MRHSALIALLAASLLAVSLAGCARAPRPAPPTQAAEEEKLAPVPDVVGMPVVDARRVLGEAGFEVLFYTRTAHATKALPSEAVTVAATKPAAGKKPPNGEVALLAATSTPTFRGMRLSPWWFPHRQVIAKTGAEPCFGCHHETTCSYCHVRLPTGERAAPYGVLEQAVEGALAAGRVDGKVREIQPADGGGRRMLIEVSAGTREGVLATALAHTAPVIAAVFSAEEPPPSLRLQWQSRDSRQPTLEVFVTRKTAEGIDWEKVAPQRLRTVVDEYRER